MNMSESPYTTEIVKVYFDISEGTVRNWSKEFADYLSPTANPGGNRPRMFTADDMAVFDLISTMKATGATYKDIQASLSNGERGTIPEATADDLKSIVPAEQDRRLLAEIDTLKIRLEEVIGERDTYRVEVAELKAEIRQLEKRINEAQERGALEGELKALRRMLDRQDE
ncbi:MAG TPA: MerR family transcriptional regulator [Anaerolineales bacterium]|nr:MerR family transcriptional regulator [Anaerolineales bacterium]